MMVSDLDDLLFYERVYEKRTSEPLAPGETVQNRIAQSEAWPTQYEPSIISDTALISCGQNFIDTQDHSSLTPTMNKQCLIDYNSGSYTYIS